MPYFLMPRAVAPTKVVDGGGRMEAHGKGTGEDRVRATGSTTVPTVFVADIGGDSAGGKITHGLSCMYWPSGQCWAVHPGICDNLKGTTPPPIPTIHVQGVPYAHKWTRSESRQGAAHICVLSETTHCSLDATGVRQRRHWHSTTTGTNSTAQLRRKPRAISCARIVVVSSNLREPAAAAAAIIYAQE